MSKKSAIIIVIIILAWGGVLALIWRWPRIKYGVESEYCKLKLPPSHGAPCRAGFDTTGKCVYAC